MPSSIEIDRLHAKVLVATDHPAPESVVSRLEDAAAHHLEGALRSIFAPWLSDSDTGIWLVRCLEVDVDVNVAWEPESVTKSWAAEIARSIGPILRGTGDGGNVVWFPDRAAYLARFIVDTADGAAQGRWYFDAFKGLGPLPMSAAIRTAAIEDAALGLDALIKLDAGEIERVIRTLTEHDAHIILDACAEVASSGGANGVAPAWRAWRESAGRAPVGGDWHQALRIFVAARSEEADADGIALRDAALAIVRLARCTAGDAAAAARLAAGLQTGAIDDAAFAPLRNAALSIRHEIVEGLLAGTGNAPEASAVRHTEFGGAFLLLPILDEMPLVEATVGWPHADACAAMTIVRTLTLAKCFGPDRSLRALGDPLLQDLMLLPVRLDSAAIAEWCSRIEPRDLDGFKSILRAWAIERGIAHAPSRADIGFVRLDGSARVARPIDRALSLAALLALRAFARRLNAFADSSAEYLHNNFLCFAASLEPEPERRIVRLGRAPLHLVLSMSGVARGEYRLRWLGETPFALFEEA